VLDTQQVVLARDGIEAVNPARLGLIALDEGVNDEERLPSALLERLAFHVVLEPASRAQDEEESLEWSGAEVAAARKLLPSVTIEEAAVNALCTAAIALGVDSLRACVVAVRVARCAAALAGSIEVAEEHTAVAARLVLAPRATRIPQPQAESEPPAEQQQEQEQQQPAPPQEPRPPADQESDPASDDAETDTQDDTDTSQEPATQGEMAERVLDAAQAAIPAGLLAALRLGDTVRAKTASAGRAGAAQKSQSRGRPIGARRSEPRAGQRLNVIETLRAAAPWQKLRQMQANAMQAAKADTALVPLPQRKIHVRKEDFHVSRFRQLGQTTTVFVVDASGSSALNRLAEAKGAVELLLADCYVRRDSVAVLAFRGKAAEVLLPATRSLTRAKRSLSGLPGGGGTPLASGIDAAFELASQIRRKGETPIIVLLTDGRGNVARGGAPGRAQAAIDATLAARQVRMAGLTALLLDTSPQPQAAAQALAAEMGASYLPLPYAGAQIVSQAVRMATGLANGPR
jgi:magnesium chelatase subunit D